MFHKEIYLFSFPGTRNVAMFLLFFYCCFSPPGIPFHLLVLKMGVGIERSGGKKIMGLILSFSLGDGPAQPEFGEAPRSLREVVNRWYLQQL